MFLHTCAFSCTIVIPVSNGRSYSLRGDREGVRTELVVQNRPSFPLQRLRSASVQLPFFTPGKLMAKLVLLFHAGHFPHPTASPDVSPITTVFIL